MDLQNMSLEDVLAKGLPFGDQRDHEQLAIRFGVKETGKLGRFRAIARCVKQIQHIKQHQKAFNEHQVSEQDVDVEAYFHDYNEDGDIYERLCFDLELTPIFVALPKEDN